MGDSGLSDLSDSADGGACDARTRTRELQAKEHVDHFLVRSRTERVRGAYTPFYRVCDVDVGCRLQVRTAVRTPDGSGWEKIRAALSSTVAPRRAYQEEEEVEEEGEIDESIFTSAIALAEEKDVELNETQAANAGGTLWI